MRFTATPLAGAFVIESERHEDERGSFERIYSARDFIEHGLEPRLAQCNLSTNPRRGTLRGLHYQVAPYEEIKMVRVIAGAIFDVMVDLREGSPTRGTWFGAELSGVNGRALYIPGGFAHGFLTLEDHSVVMYQMSDTYNPEASRGIRWDDPTIAIPWPFPPSCLGERDRNLPYLAR